MKLNMQELAVRTGCLAAGGIGAGVLNKHLPAAISENLRPLAIIAAGALIPAFVGKGKNKVLNHVGDGMIASGATALVQRLVPGLAGLGDEFVAGGEYVYVPGDSIEGVDEDGPTTL